MTVEPHAFDKVHLVCCPFGAAPTHLLGLTAVAFSIGIGAGRRGSSSGIHGGVLLEDGEVLAELELAQAPVLVVVQPGDGRGGGVGWWQRRR